MAGSNKGPLPSGTVGLIGMDTARYSEFAASIARLDKPANWEVIGAYNYDEAHARNALVDRCQGEYLWFMDDDHSFQPDILRHLLAHRLDVVCPLVLQRKPPFQPVAIVNGEYLKPDANLGLKKVDIMGTAGMLIRRSVFDKLERPYFHNYDEPDNTHWPSDMNFCKALGEAGVDLYVDTSVSMAHWNALAVYPRLENGRWVVGGAVANAEAFKWPLGSHGS